MMYIHEHRNQLERQAWASALTQLLSTWGLNYKGLPSKGSPILMFASLGSLNEIPSKHEILHVQQLNGIESVVYI